MKDVTDMKGVTEWDRKLAAFKLLFNVSGDKELSTAVVPENGLNFYDRIRKFAKNKPKNLEQRRFFDNVVSKLECANMNGQKLVLCTFEEFISSLPTSKKEILGSSELDSGDIPIYRSRFLDINNKEQEWLRDGYIDQKFLYLNHDSVLDWRNVIMDPEYKTYRYCSSSLQNFLQSQTLSELLGKNPVRTVVLMGAGTPSKESMVISSILAKGSYEARSPLRTVIVDSSYYMLCDSESHIKKSLETKGVAKSVEMVPCIGDFLRLKSRVSRIRPTAHSERIAFFLLGATIGNIDERKFLESVHQISVPGDLLIIGTEFIDEEDPDYKDKLLENYDTDSVRDLVLEPVRKLLDRNEVSGDRATRRKLVTVHLRENDRYLSPIEGTIAAEMRITTSCIDLGLSVSKRYRETTFKKFFEESGFRVIEPCTPCKEYPPYKQVLFTRE